MFVLRNVFRVEIRDDIGRRENQNINGKGSKSKPWEEGNFYGILETLPNWANFLVVFTLDNNKK